MANNGLKVTTSELKKVLSSLKTERDTLNNVYNSQIKEILESSQSCFQIAGLDPSQISSTIESTFKTLNSNFNDLIGVLDNNVIKNYDELLTALNQKFGAQFASQMQNLLGLK